MPRALIWLVVLVAWCGPIATVFALMSYLIAIGVLVILGAVTGLVWQERGPSFRAAFRKPRPNRN